jgi:formylglycine-generating enzyme required for sulfatase activity
VPELVRNLLPVRLTLRTAAVHIPPDAECGKASMIWNALQADVIERIGQAAAEHLFPHLQERLMRTGLFLLDGLDEVPEAGRRRKCLLEAIQNLAASLPPKRRILLTARPYAYADPQWRLPDFQIIALAPFNEKQVSRFVERWYEAVRPAMGWDAANAQDHSRRLAQALQERAYLADLASRPLLLTLMATLHSSWGQLPEDRADLYEESVKLLLSRWQRGRQVKGLDGKLMLEPGIERALGIGEERIRAALEKLAFQIHLRQGSQAEREDAPADIPLGEVLSVFTPLLPDDFNPALLLVYLETRAGLLIGRREGVYAFPHRSFQEYLAACHLANAEPMFADKLRELVWQDAAWWREVFLLGVGKAKQGGLSNAVSILNVLLPEGPEDVSEPAEPHWQCAWLTGQALVELQLASKAVRQAHYEALLKRARRWLVMLIEGGHLAPRDRLNAGDALGKLGDPRPGVGITVSQGRTIPDIVWVEIPGGPFTMGSSKDTPDTFEDERPAHTVELPWFHISRYPITNAQYRPFVELGGYDTPEWWTPEGWAWRNGAEADLSPIDDKELKKDWVNWLANRPAEKRRLPYWWNDPQWGAATRPVVGITWYEALAFARWLERQLQLGAAFQILSRAQQPMPKTFTVRLPTEAEWEKAARAADARRWPWGDSWQDDHANTKEVGLEQTSPVGLFHRGASPYGVLDMIGNVWEWTSTRWGKTSIYKFDYGYPYNPKDGREKLDGHDLRVLRGGSWYYSRRFARCACRNRNIPFNWYDNVGFRVVVSLAEF